MKNIVRQLTIFFCCNNMLCVANDSKRGVDMENYRVLYDIKSLESLILRTFICDMTVQKEKREFFPTPTQVQIIEYIVNAKTDVYQKDLENILNLRRATVSGVLQTMEKNNLIKRISSNIDARAKKILLNDKAKELFLERKNKLEEIEMVVTKDISVSDLEIFSNVLKNMKNNINDYLLNQNDLVALKRGDK